MAVSKSPKQFTQQDIDGVESSPEEGKNFNPPRILLDGKFYGALTGQQSRLHNGGNSSATDIHEPEIDDAEVTGYLNTKQEVRFKRILWEAMNREYSKVKKPKQKTELKRSISVQNAAKGTPKIEKKRPSSKINYDALRKLTDELG